MKGAAGNTEQFQDYVSNNSFREITNEKFSVRARSQGRAVGLDHYSTVNSLVDRLARGSVAPNVQMPPSDRFRNRH